MARGWLLFLVCVALFGCTGIADDRTAIRLTNWGGAGDGGDFDRLVKQLYREFETHNPDLDLKVEGIPGSQEYVTKLLLSFVAGTEPDIITLDASSSAVFIENGVLMDLAPIAASDPDFQLDDYWPNVVDIARRGEKLYAIPVDFTPMVMYYNRRMFREAGIPEPRPGWTYAEFLAAARSLTKPGQYGFEFANWMPGWITWLWNNGGDVLHPETLRAVGTFDSDANVAAVEFLRDLITVHKAAPSLSQAASTGVDLFATNQAAMKISGHWSLVGFADTKSSKIALDDIGVVELPTNLPQSVTVMYESGLAIGKNCRNPEAAWRFIKYMTSRPVQERYNASGIAVCGRRDVALAKESDRLEMAFNRIVPSARAPWGTRIEAYAVVEDIGQRMMGSVLQQGRPVREALRKAAEAIDRELARQ